jgi:quinol-cytochrome oxidoreductase complex cytochrome b subunit
LADLVFGLLALSGACWLVLHYLLARPGEFGVLRHPLEAPVLTAHGVIAMLAIYVSGWIGARHAQEGWMWPARRISGVALAATLMVAAVSGLAQFFIASERAQSMSTLVHEIAGVLLVVALAGHWRRKPPRQ